MNLSRFILPVLALLCLTPWVGSAAALFAGFILALTFGNSYLERTKKITPLLLGLAVMGLGAGMDLMVVARVGLQGVGYTVLGIGFTFLLGHFLGKFLKVEGNTSILISSGTAICGGSAIAAVAQAIKAKSHEISVALGAVFILNAVALVLFPWIGHILNLSQEQFGLWAALAIHDTSSVVGASLHYGARAVEVATTLKLARALWILPVAFVIAANRARAHTSIQKSPLKIPWFIPGFLLMAALVSFFPELQSFGHLVEKCAKQLMVLTLFLIGCNLTPETLKSVGVKPLLQALVLWVAMASVSLGAIYYNWIHVG